MGHYRSLCIVVTVELFTEGLDTFLQVTVAGLLVWFLRDGLLRNAGLHEFDTAGLLDLEDLVFGVSDG